MIGLFIFFVCEDSKQLVPHFYGAIFPFYTDKCSEDVEDAAVSALCRSAPPHAVRCPGERETLDNITGHKKNILIIIWYK